MLRLAVDGLLAPASSITWWSPSRQDLLDSRRSCCPVGDAIVVAGGAERVDSVRARHRRRPGRPLLLVHDAARALTPPDMIAPGGRRTARGHRPSCPRCRSPTRSRPSTQLGYVDRDARPSELRAVQTPQGFDADLLRARLSAAEARICRCTDDAGWWRRWGCRCAPSPATRWPSRSPPPLDLGCWPQAVGGSGERLSGSASAATCIRSSPGGHAGCGAVVRRRRRLLRAIPTAMSPATRCATRCCRRPGWATSALVFGVETARLGAA